MVVVVVLVVFATRVWGSSAAGVLGVVNFLDFSFSCCYALWGYDG